MNNLYNKSPSFTMEDSHPRKIRYGLLAAVLILTALLFLWALQRIHVDTDVVASLPSDNPVIADAVYLFKHHPIQDRIAIDLQLETDNQDLLVKAGTVVEGMLRQSGLFKSVGNGDVQAQIPRLIRHIQDNLPFLFTSDALVQEVLPKLSPEAVQSRLKTLHQRLTGLEGIGQSAAMAADPLGISEIKMAEMRLLAPARNVKVVKGNLLSPDGRHLLILAVPDGSGTDTALAGKLSALLAEIQQKAATDTIFEGNRLLVMSVGAYRSALDNETIVRGDVTNALFFSTLGIAILLAVSFPRPLIGMLALLPAIFGTAAALFIFSIFNERISIMALGFGGAIISITVDVGISYLLFVDRHHGTRGREASREVWAVGLLAVLTTVGAFLCLSLTGFEVFSQMGVFTALGSACSFLFVHSVFPLIFDTLPPAQTAPRLILHRIVDRITDAGTKGPLVALIIGGLLAVLANPQFNVKLTAMNTVSPETKAAETLFSEVWGDIFSKVYLMTEAGSMAELQEKNDRLSQSLEEMTKAGVIRDAISFSAFFPGADSRRRNHEAWVSFWNSERVAQVREMLNQEGGALGFLPEAFDPFIKRISPEMTGSIPAFANPALSHDYFDLFSISDDKASGIFRQVTSVTPGPAPDGWRLSKSLEGIAKIFDPKLFSSEMGRVLFGTFGKLLLIVGGTVVLMIFLSFLDIWLTLTTLLPVAFAFSATLGTLSLMGRSLDIPSLMLSIIIFGMGIDYSLFFVESFQRYQRYQHPHFALIRASVFITAASTLIGFGVLFAARHALLKSAGVTSFFGVFYSLLGTVLIVPPILKRRFETDRDASKPSGDIYKRIMGRFRNLETYPRLFARFKLRLDPMFSELEGIVQRIKAPKTILDIGTGFGVPASWFVERFPGAKIYGIEPNPDRVRVAGFVLGQAGSVKEASAPEVPQSDLQGDLALMLDMSHYLSDEELVLTLSRLKNGLSAGAVILIRMETPPLNRFPIAHWMEHVVCWIRGIQPRYRSAGEMEAFLKQTGFRVKSLLPSGSREDLVWVLGRVKDPEDFTPPVLSWEKKERPNAHSI